MGECIFCRIVKGYEESAKIWEDDDFLAILDVMPNTKGMTLLITKKHYDSYVFDMDDEFYKKYMAAAKKVAKILEKGLKVKRVAMVIEGMGINHSHIKLYPLHGLKEKFTEMWTKEKVWFDKYPGYITTHTGHRVEVKKLKKLAEKIKNKK
ncbi:MAG: HIT domain-containing protein [Candidatus Aenigmarchaeota archaeon]|nr:HIT domain-containing protein [Candidatus Aenigmarchaeota archaeon]